MMATPTGDALNTVCTWLEGAGLPDFFACFDPLHPRYERWLTARDSAPAEVQPIIDLFLLAGSVSESELHEAPREALSALVDAGVLKVSADRTLSLGGLVLLPTLGGWLLCQKPQVNPTLYFGDDSVALANRLRARPNDRALDLCSGPGIQAIRLAKLGARVTAVEINPVAAALAQMNLAINGVADRVEVRVGNLYEAVPGESFDVITANPPLLPIPDTLPYPFVGHGGPDGLRVVRHILKGLPAALAPKGVARLLGTTLSDGYLPHPIDELDRWARECSMDLTMFITSHHRLGDGDAYFEGLAATSAATGGLELAEARSRFRAFLTEVGASHMCAYFLHIRHGRGGAQLVDIASEPAADIWFA